MEGKSNKDGVTCVLLNSTLKEMLAKVPNYK